jgi:hypothetical protein
MTCKELGLDNSVFESVMGNGEQRIEKDGEA